MKIKKIRLLLLISATLLIACFDSTGQTRGLKYSKQTSTFDLIIGGDFGFRLISGDKSNPTVNQEINNREQFENQKLNYRFGFNYYHGLTGRLLIKTGIRLANPGFSISSIQKINPELDINTINKSYKQHGPEYRYKYQLIEIPIGVKYVISGSSCKPYVEVALSTNYYWRTVVEEKNYEGGSRSSIISENINKVNFIGNFSAGGDFIITDKLSGFSQLVTRYQLNNLRNGDLKEKIFGIGLEMGIRYHL